MEIFLLQLSMSQWFQQKYVICRSFEVMPDFIGFSFNSLSCLLPCQVLAELKPFLDLANSLGKFAVQLIAGKGGLKSVKVAYASARESDQLDTKLLRVGIIKGLMEPISSIIVNWANADKVAQQRGIRIIEERISLHGSPEYPLEFMQLQVANVESRFASALSKSGEIEVEGQVI